MSPHNTRTIIVGEYERFLRGWLFVIAGIIFVTPILVSSAYFFPFITTKTLAFRLLVEGMVGAYILLAFSFRRYRPQMTLVHWAVLLYLAVVTAASILGVNPYRSFWSNAERGEGLLTLYHVAAFFFTASFSFREWRDWRSLFLVSLIASVGAGIYGVAQLLGWKTILFGTFNVLGSGRIASTIGNASFFAGYLLLQIIIGGIVFIKEQSVRWRVAVSAITLFNAFMLYETQTRGAFLGLLVGLFILGILAAVTHSSRKMRLGVAGMIVLVGVMGTFAFFNRDAEWVQRSGTLKRIVTISRTDITTQNRLAAWGAAWKGWRERPLLGWGYENFNVPFNKYFPSIIYRDEGSQVWFDKAHNIIFEVGVGSGFLGLIAYASIFAALGFILWKAVKQSDQNRKFIIFIIIGGTVGYIFQNLFVFDTIATYISFFAILAFVTVIGRDTEQTYPESIPASVRHFSSALFFAIAIIIGILAYGFNIKPGMANRAVAAAFVAKHEGKLQETRALFKQGIDMRTYMRFEARQRFSEFAVQVLRNDKIPRSLRLEILREASSELEKSVKEQPLTALNYVYLMNLYNNGDALDPTVNDKLRKIFKKAVALSPTRAQFYFSLGQAEISSGNSEAGLKAFKKAVEISPNVMETHWNLGAVLILTGHEEGGELELKKAAQLGLDLNSPRHLRKILRVWSAKRNMKKLAETYEKLVRVDPNAADYASLAAVYKELGDKEKAIEATRKAVELDSSYAAEAKIFINRLKKGL